MPLLISSMIIPFDDEDDDCDDDCNDMVKEREVDLRLDTQIISEH